MHPRVCPKRLATIRGSVEVVGVRWAKRWPGRPCRYRRLRYSAFGGHVDGKKIDAGSLHRLWIQLDQFQDLERHTNLDWKADRTRFLCGERIVMRPLPSRELRREVLCRLLFQPRGQQFNGSPLDLCKGLFAHVRENE